MKLVYLTLSVFLVHTMPFHAVSAPDLDAMQRDIAKKMQRKRLNNLNKVFHHRSHADALELGQLVFYFDKEVQLKEPSKKSARSHAKTMHERQRSPQTASKNPSKIELVYTIPSSKITTSAHAMINTINKTPHLPYQATIKDAHGDLTITIAYDPKKVTVECDAFTAIDLQKGITFRFLNKELLDALHNKTYPLLRTAALKKKRGIVVDCGHGGADFGAVSSHNLAEKKVSLQVGLYLAQLLRNDGYEVFLTRDADTTVALDERTTFANNCEADLFVSIHANHAPNKKASGIELFCLADSLFKPCTGECSLAFGQVQPILAERNMQSNMLATCVHKHLIGALKKRYTDIVDRGIKHAVTQVLLGTNKPAILAEIGFLSHPQEAKRLASVAYQQEVAAAIKNGIDAFRLNSV